MFSCILTGKIPLRELVYRVLDLPPSMRPLVYDFGQLSVDTEKEYTKQIVFSRCKEIPKLESSGLTMDCVARVLAWSQNYMRRRNVSLSRVQSLLFNYLLCFFMQDECSFVSLRDVERAMIVFKYFCEKVHLFSEAIIALAKDEVGSKFII